jgi:hypothetical protein
MCYPTRIAIALVIGLSTTNPLAFCQGQAKYRVLDGWSISEQRKPETLFQASEQQFADRVFDPRADTLRRHSRKPYSIFPTFHTKEPSRIRMQAAIFFWLNGALRDLP